MDRGTRTVNPGKRNKGLISTFQPPEEGRSVQQLPLMVFYLSLSDSISPQLSRTLLSIQADLNAVVWMISILPLISNSSSLFQSLWGSFQHGNKDEDNSQKNVK